MASINPFDYRPAEIAKSLVALLTSVIALGGVLAATLTTGGLADAGAWVAGIAVFLTPIVVFLKRAALVADLLDGGEDAGGAHRSTPAGD